MQEKQLSIISRLRQQAENQATRSSDRQNIQNQSQDNQFNDSKKTNQKPNIFQRNKQNSNPIQPINIFNKTQKSINLFTINANQPSINIFSKQQYKIPQIRIQKNNQQQENESQYSKQQEKPYSSEPQQKIMKFEYQILNQKIKDFKIRKFRNGTNIPKENIIISLQQPKNNHQILYLIARTRQTHICLFSSLIVKSISKIQDFMGKEQNAKIEVVKKEQIDGKVIKQTIKLQFEQPVDCRQFKQIVNKFLKTTQ